MENEFGIDFGRAFEEPESEENIEEQPIEEVNETAIVTDFEFSVNTMSSGYVSYITPKLNGVLEGIFILAPSQIQLAVYLENDIPIFEMQSYKGYQYVPIRSEVVSNLGEHFRDGYTKIALNDKLKFEVKGRINSEIKFIVRYC